MAHSGKEKVARIKLEFTRVIGLTYKNGPTTLGTLTYGYDGNGGRRQVGGTWTRTGLPQALASATYDAGNRQVTFGGAPLTYDLNGNLLGDGTTTYTWDARDRLGGLSNVGMTASFQCDAVNRRVGKTVDGTLTSVLHAGIDPAQETTGTAVKSILTGLDVDEYLSHASSTGETRFALADALGSTVALLDPGGTVVTEYTYEPFGATTQSGVPSEHRAQYTGRENDATDLYYYRARYYQTVRQRFISEDPLEFLSGSTNLFAYVDNSPTNYVDPTGEFLLAGCASGAAWSLAFDGVTWILSGRKPDPLQVLSNAVIGCASGAVGGQLMRWFQIGKEFRLGTRLKVAPFGNRTNNPYGRWPHYHRGVPIPSSRAVLFPIKA
jgi:RHS repeat-associated protein